jgi:DNA-binding Lrp family transcriptional regulator
MKRVNPGYSRSRERLITCKHLDMPKEMDDIDRKLLVLIEAEPRIHYRELAKRVGISRQAAYHRICVLTELGVLKGGIVGVSISYLDAIPVCVFGKSKSALDDQRLDRLGDNDSTRRVVMAGGNQVYVVGFLRDIPELGDYVDFVTRTTEMSEPVVGIYCLDDGLSPSYYVDGGRRQRIVHHRELSPLDLKIVAALEEDVRKPTAEIASEIGVSAKTVRRRLNAMMADGSLEFNVPQDLQSGGDMFLLMHVCLKDGVDKIKFGKNLLAKHPFVDAYVRSFTNIPNLLVWVIWSNSIIKVREALKKVGEDKDVTMVTLNFVYAERIYSTWRDRIPAHEARNQNRRMASRSKPTASRAH